MNNTLTMHMDDASKHYRMCTKCTDNPAIKEMLIQLVLMIMDGTHESWDINKYAMTVTRAMCNNHTFIKDGRNHTYLHIEFVNRDMLIRA